MATLLFEDFLKTTIEILVSLFFMARTKYTEKLISKGKIKEKLSQTQKKTESFIHKFHLEPHATENCDHIFAGIMLGAGIPLVYFLIGALLLFKYWWEKIQCTPFQ